MLRMRGSVSWEHERIGREEREEVIRAAEEELREKTRSLEERMQHVAEVVCILR